MSNAITSQFPGTLEVTESIPMNVPLEESMTAFHVTETAFIQLHYRGVFTHVVEKNCQIRSDNPFSCEALEEEVGHVDVVRAGTYGASRVRRYLLRTHDDSYIFVSAHQEWLSFMVGATAQERADQLTQLITERFHRELQTPERTRCFIHLKEQYGEQSSNFDDVRWEKARQNYPRITAEGLDKLMDFSATPSASAGRIIVLHGEPGTGKTWALRALLTAWKNWAEGAIIFDPEVMMTTPSYLVNAMKHGDPKKTNVLIFEDADELVGRNDRRNQGVVRLLNAAEGILGASTNALIIFTTNAAPDQLDPAIVRPGRCLASIEFRPFDIASANERLKGVATTDRALTLAEIYDRLSTSKKVVAGTPAGPTGQYL
jgi:hypothetical protein